MKQIKPTMESVKTKMTRRKLFVLLCVICVVIQEGIAKYKVAGTVVQLYGGIMYHVNLMPYHLYFQMRSNIE